MNRKNAVISLGRLGMALSVGRLDLNEALGVYNAYRAKIVAEDQLVNHRVSWMLWFEAILFAIWGALAIPDRVAGGNDQFLGGALAVVSILGIFAAVASRRAIDAAVQEMEDVKSRYKAAFPELWESSDLVPRLHSGKSIFTKGLGFAETMPLMFIVLHSLALVYVVVVYFAQGPA